MGAIGAYLRAHRAVRDVDPDTGHEQPEEPAGPAEPAVGPAAGGEGGGGAAPAGDEPRA
jgi:hypothetical protein